MNPIENVWSLLDQRLQKTEPGGFETERAFKGRVRSAVRHLNTSSLTQLQRAVDSMPARVEALIKVKGAMTKY